MRTLTVELGARSYPIHIGPDLLADGALLRSLVPADQVLIVTNETVAPLYLNKVESAYAGRKRRSLVLPDGEQYKTIERFVQVIDELIDAGFHRDACIVALGGGVIGDLAGYAAAAFQRGIDFLQVPTTLLAHDAEALTHAITRCCEIKAAIVAEDEREHGRRALLNFGHTFGHAIEAGLGFGRWLHGEAVAAGMVMAADLSARLGMLDRPAAERLRRLLERAGLPVTGPQLGPERYLDLMAIDKKAEAGRIRYILLDRIGAARITDSVSPEALQATLRACSSSGGTFPLPPSSVPAGKRLPRQGES